MAKRALVLCMLLTGLSAGLGAQGNIIQRIIVKVNGEILTMTELEQRQIEILRQRNPQMQASDMKNDALRTQLAEITPQILTDAVDELLMIQRGRELGFRMSDEQFKNVLEQVKKQNNITEQQLVQALAAEGLSMQLYREMMEKQFLIRGVEEREIMGQMNLTESELKMYYQAHPEKFQTPATVTLREILISVPTETRGGQSVFSAGADDAAKEKIEAARARVVGGEDFAKVVAELSESGSKANEGLVGPVNLGEIDRTLAAVFDKLKVGEISQPIRSSRGYQIFKLESRAESATRPYTEVRTEIEQLVSSERLDKERAKFIDKLRLTALIEWKDENYKKLYEQARQGKQGL
jgi:peptidyl-prolyl cis-trans isomerase SurA